MNVSRILLAVFRMLAALPYSWLRRLGNLAGLVLYWGVRRRTNIARVNLRLCFPQMSEREREALILAHCKFFARSFLDRFMLWYRPVDYIEKLVRLEDAHLLDELSGKPVILLAPHFLGMDAGGTRLSINRTMFTMFANQKNKVFNEEMRKGRERFSDSVVLLRQDGLRGAVRKLRQGIPFYFLPDMDLGARDSVFVPFFGVPAATVTSVARLAQMTGARILPCVTLMTDTGYRTRIYPAWEDFPGEDLEAATRRMNEFIEARVLEAPAQYLWTHKRFKTRPPGEPDPYRVNGQPVPDTETEAVPLEDNGPATAATAATERPEARAGLAGAPEDAAADVGQAGPAAATAADAGGAPGGKRPA